MENVKLVWTRSKLVEILPWLVRALKITAQSITSATFVLAISAPFVAWAVLLMWVDRDFPDQVAVTVAAGPGILLYLWLIAVVGWLVAVTTFGLYRQALALGMAMALLLNLYRYLPPVPIASASQGLLPAQTHAKGSP